MKKWQKITGCVLFTLIFIYDFLTWANLYVHIKYVVEPTDNDLLIEQSYIYADGMSFGMWLNLSMAVFFFACLWRREINNDKTH